MSHIKEFLTYRALAFKYSSSGSLDPVLDSMSENETATLPLKNVCARVSIELADRLDKTLQVLDISKRTFIESAIISALDEFDDIAKDLDIFTNQ